MQSGIAPPLEPEAHVDGHVAPVVGALALINEALAACLEEIESLQRRVARLERERESRAS